MPWICITLSISRVKQGTFTRSGDYYTTAFHIAAGRGEDVSKIKDRDTKFP